MSIRSTRGRRDAALIALGTTAALFSVAILLSVLGPTRDATGRSEDVESSTVASVAAALRAPAERVASVIVRPGDTLHSLLERAGVPADDARAAIDALLVVFRPREIRPGQRIELTFANAVGEDAARFGGAPGTSAFTSLMRVALRPSPEREIRVLRTEEGAFQASAFAVPLERRLAHAEGRIDSSLYHAASRAGVPLAVMSEAIKRFGFSVDFQRDVQRGDAFSILYETLHDETGAVVGAGDLLHAELDLSGNRRGLWRFIDESGRVEYFDNDGRSAQRTLMRTPIDGARLSSGYGMRRHPVLGYSRQHKGIDFAAPKGTPIWAAGDGVVAEAGWKSGYGRYVRLRHGNGFETAYAHMSGFAKGVSRGARVTQGQVIGFVGATGMATGPHLHYEVLVDGRHRDPRTVPLPEGRALDGAELARFHEQRLHITGLAMATRTRTVMEARLGDIGLAGPYLR